MGAGRVLVIRTHGRGNRLPERLWKVSAGFLAIAAGLCAATATAQDFSAGKTAAQLFASDCTACHKSAGGLAKGQSVSSLTSFLREHYTTKTESASALAAYLAGAGRGNARLNPQAPITGARTKNAAGNDEKPTAKPRTAAPATTAATAEPEKQPDAEANAPRETAKPPADAGVAKLNSYAAARGEPKDTAKLDEPTAKRKPPEKKRETTALTGDAQHPPRPRRALTPIIRPPPGNN